MKLTPLTLTDAKAFVADHHRHNKPPQGGRFAVGLLDGDALVGVAIVGRPVARLLDDAVTAEVTRCCVRPDAPKNACSMLYGACWRAWRAMGGERLITYTLQKEPGTSLHAAGFALVAQTQPQSWRRPNIGRDRAWDPVYAEPKCRWQRHQTMKESKLADGVRPLTPEGDGSRSPGR